MCGICGAAALSGALDPAAAAALPAMNAALAHRGPDGEGRYLGVHAILGHRRLAIIDRAGGAQPIANETGTCRVVLNGEIYNHADLRRTLEARGHRFRTASDTEVIVHAYEEFGSGAAERLEGMFALAVYDEPRRELWLARDRLGKKPLFYRVFDGALYFASEIGALAAAPGWDDALDTELVAGYVALGYVPAPRTLLRHVRKLPAGHWLQLRAGRIDIRQFWDVNAFDTDGRRDDELCADIQSRLETATRHRLESEVPLGAFLSGGIDSGLVVAAMARQRTRVTTTTVGFDAAAHNELALAASTARAFDTRHHARVIDANNPDAILQAIDALDEPLADPSVVPTFHVSAVARRFVTVALTGDGGDETFGGYSFRYVPHGLEAAARPFAQQLVGRRLLNRLARAWPRGNAFDNLAAEPVDAYFSDLCFVKPRAAAALVGREASFDVHDTFAYHAVTAAYRRCPSTNAVQRAMYADLKGYMTDDVLVKVDRMSMRHALEIRCPLLDHRLVELAFAIPAARKLSMRRSKRLLRAIAQAQLPHDVVDGRKRGFTAPAAEWLRGVCRPLFDADVLGSSSAAASVFDVREVRRLFDEHRDGRRNHAPALWAIWVFERWRQRCRRACHIERKNRNDRRDGAETIERAVA